MILIYYKPSKSKSLFWNSLAFY